MIDLEVLNPFDGNGSWKTDGWDDIRKSMDTASIDPPHQSDITEILYVGSGGDEWDGLDVLVVKLKDNRYMAYEASYGPTGSGFSEDAYGGDAEVWFGYDLNNLVLQALTDRGRRMVGIPEEGLNTTTGGTN